MVTPSVALLGLIPIAYCIGSIPFGLVVGLSRGIDPRKAGSGNIGATNIGRLLGGKFFALVFLLDLLKGLLPTLAGGAVLHFAARDAHSYLLWLLVGFAAILGHMYSIFLKFRGGKGVATSAGVILGVFPYYTLPGGIALLIFALVFKATKYVSVGSMVAAVSFSLIYLMLGLWRHWGIWGDQWPLLAFAALVTGLIIYKHRGNVARLRAGTEHRFGRAGARETAAAGPTSGVVS